MKEYFSTLIQIKNDTIAVQGHFFETYEKSVKLSYFFGDDDYEKDLEKNFEFIDGLDLHLQLGFYYFLDYEEMLREKFSNCFDFEEYDEMIQKTDILITSSPQAVLDSLACGGRPIYFQREDYTQDMNDTFKSLNIPIIENYDKNHLNMIIKTINNIKYVKITQKDNKVIKLIKENLVL
jgi:hypothetical protein